MLGYRSLRAFAQVLSTKTLYPLHLGVGALRAISNKCHGDDVIGIDLGTKYARVAVMVGEVPTTIDTISGYITPSLVAVDDEKGILAGEAAKADAITCSPSNVLFRMKDFVGRSYNDPQMQKLKTMVPFKICGDANGNVLMEVSNKNFSPTEVCGFILDEMKKTAELYLRKTISNAVISVPFDFTDSQRKEMVLAGNSVGLNVIHLIDEPVAAILASKRKRDGIVIVLTMGGGRCVVSVVEMHDGVIEVKAQHGDSFWGGDDFDRVLRDHLVKEIKEVHDVDLTSDRTAMIKLKEAAERAKINLSHLTETVVHGHFGTRRGPINVNITISRATFEGLVDGLIEKARLLCNKCLKEVAVNEIDEVFVVGGMAKVPAVQQIVQDIFKKPPSIMDFEPEEAVVLGASIHGALKREEKSISQLGSLPLSIGVETWGATFTKMIRRNSKLPAKGIKTFSTEYDNQGSLVFRILYGEGWMANNSTTIVLGELELKGIPPAPQGVLRIELTLEVDETGDLRASAKVEGVKRTDSLKVPLDLKHEHVWRLVREAILNSPTEIQQYRLARLRSRATSLIYRLENTLKRKGNDIPEELRARGHSAIADLRGLLDTRDVYRITKMMNEMRTMGMAIVLEACAEEEKRNADSDDDEPGYYSG